MVQSYTAIRDLIEQYLQDTANARFETTELDLYMKDGLREISAITSHLRREVFQLESRTGTATETSAGNLVDDSNDQFVAGDVGKVVYNKTDKTWAVITEYTDETTVVVSNDIFASGEEYEIFNEGCIQNNQINIEDITDRIDIRDGDRVEYPIGTQRNIEVDGDIVTLGIDTSQVPDSGDSSNENDAYIWFRCLHKLSQLTDFAGAVDLEAGYSAGDTSMVVDGLQSAGTIEAGQEFTIASTRGLYRVTADATIATNEATITFYPPLESDVADGAVVTFIQSTLTPELEPLYAKYVAGMAAMAKGSLVDKVFIGSQNVPNQYYNWGSRMKQEAEAAIRRLTRPRSNKDYTRSYL